MKQIKMETSILKNALKIAVKVISQKSYLESLKYFKCEVKISNKRTILVITATNSHSLMAEQMCQDRVWDTQNSQHISVTIPCESNQEFIFFLPADELKLLEKLKGQSLTITVDEKTLGAQLTTDHETVSIGCANPQEFPATPDVTSNKICRVTNDFVTEIKRCLKYVSTDDLRPALCGIQFKIQESKIKLCATDGHVLRTSNLCAQPDPEVEGESFILNRGFCKIVSSIKNADEIQIAKMGMGDTTCSVLTCTSGEMTVEIIGRNVYAQYPDYEAFIPKTSTTQIGFDKKESLQHINKVLLSTSTINTKSQVIFSINGKLALSARGYNAEFEAFSKTGADLEIAFRLEYLKLVIGNIITESVSLEMNKPNQVVVFRDSNSLTLLMPVIVNSEER